MGAPAIWRHDHRIALYRQPLLSLSLLYLFFIFTLSLVEVGGTESCFQISGAPISFVSMFNQKRGKSKSFKIGEKIKCIHRCFECNPLKIILPRSGDPM